MTSQTNQTTEEADTSASVAEPGAPVASRKTRSKKGSSPKKSVAKAGTTAAKRPPTKAAANQTAKAAESKRTPKAPKKIVQTVAGPAHKSYYLEGCNSTGTTNCW